MTNDGIVNSGYFRLFKHAASVGILPSGSRSLHLVLRSGSGAAPCSAAPAPPFSGAGCRCWLVRPAEESTDQNREETDS